ELEALDAHRELTALRFDHGALGADPVAARDAVAERLELLVADVALAHEQLQLTGAVAQRDEDELALTAHEHGAAGDAHHIVARSAGLETRIPPLAHFGEGVRAIEAIRRVVGHQLLVTFEDQAESVQREPRFIVLHGAQVREDRHREAARRNDRTRSELSRKPVDESV